MERSVPEEDDEFWAMARRVRQAADEELAEIEYETERAEQKRQDLTTRSVQAMMEGERWQLAVGSRLIDGNVVHAGQDYVGLQDRVGNLHDVHHAAIALITITEADPRQGRAPTTFRPATLRARLLGFEQVRDLELGDRRGAWALRGRVESVNVDHLVFHEHSGQIAVAPLDAIGWISRAPQGDRRGGRRLPPG